MKETEMNLKEYEKHFFSSLSKQKKILTKIKIIQWKFIKHPFGWNYRTRINPYNPLTYLFLITAIPIAVVMYTIIYGPKFVGEILSAFKYH